ncbi:diaminopimelate decarboxylase family protein [Conexibacter woesei]|uniref:Diaminopimelate decarboxylase n=1 Tax=Conexibacter woesei (strain DSM 14684 / CCUG 47730 / CIP 108061 / JCM 11494 / NBRC 100937 / ID131577) TaxID=469383 RepID=D3F5D7_CONWI|nr:diaminopimelate decarboxylase [Conexibacter woesei]ADB50604.1 Diaminopimelate decarboxylase [Conexibacter woesei DSM 14684]
MTISTAQYVEDGRPDLLTRVDGRLAIEGLRADELVARFGSPLFVVSEPALRARARRVQAAFAAAWPEGPVVVLPAVKASTVVALHRVLAQEGCGADLYGGAELEIAVRAGTDPDRISVNGTAKDRPTIERAIALGARITIDDVHEVEIARDAARALGRPARLRVRLRPEILLDAPSDGNAMIAATDGSVLRIKDAYGRYKPGVPFDDMARIGRSLDAPEIEMIGVHMHFPRHTTDLGVIGHVADRYAALIAELSELWDGWTPRQIDVGGGFAPPGDPFGRRNPSFAHRTPPPIEAYASTIAEHLRTGLARHGIDTAGRQLEVEPGRSLFGPVGVHLATVLNVKRQTRPFPHAWVETDTTQHFLPGVGQEWDDFPVAFDRVAGDGELTADVVGRSCMGDVLASDAPVPAPVRGDVLAFASTGAYQETSASNFNALPRPATVLVDSGQAHLVRRAETVDDVLGRDALPAHLAAEAAR